MQVVVCESGRRYSEGEKIFVVTGELNTSFHVDFQLVNRDV
jgi:hypothetical protein